jgi:hypothetical protein
VSSTFSRLKYDPVETALSEKNQLPSAEKRTPILYGSKFGLLQFSTEHGQMLGVAIACGRFFGGISYCPFRTENWLYSVERIAAGETVDSKNRQ